MITMKSIFILLYIIGYFQAEGGDKYTDGNRPYEFGFTIEGEQHRHEKKDENGIIMGEFGFITADGVYHVTVYATDENGNFKILSMKNIRVKPYPTAPGIGESKSQSLKNSVPSVNARQGHSITLPISHSDEVKKISRNEIQLLNSKKSDGSERSCSHCSIPTTTTLAPKLINTIETLDRTYENNKFLSQNQEQNTPVISMNLNQQIYKKDNQKYPILSTYDKKSSGNRETNKENTALLSSPKQFTYEGNLGMGMPYLRNSEGIPNYKTNSQTAESVLKNSNPDPKYFKENNVQYTDNGQNVITNAVPQITFSEDNSQKSQNNQNYLKQYSTPNKNLQVPATQKDYSEYSNLGPLSPSFRMTPSESPIFSNSNKNVPESNPNGYRHPKSFDDILQSTNPDQSLYRSNAPDAGKNAIKPTLIAAQMQIVDKNTDIYHKKAGEKDGLPNGLNTEDITTLLYTFNYTLGFHGHHEKGYVNGAKIGYYFVTGRNGIRTRVDYEADEKGFRPRISQETLDVLSDEVPKYETEKDEKYGLKGYEFKWLYYPVGSTS